MPARQYQKQSSDIDDVELDRQLQQELLQRGKPYLFIANFESKSEILTHFIGHSLLTPKRGFKHPDFDPDMAMHIGSPYNRKNDPLMDDLEESDQASLSPFA